MKTILLTHKIDIKKAEKCAAPKECIEKKKPNCGGGDLALTAPIPT